MTTFAVILAVLLILSWGIFLSKTKVDGRLIIDEAADSWTISITTDPETIKKRKSITLTVDNART